MKISASLVLIAVLVAAAAWGTSAWAAGPMKIGDVKPYRAETPHPYPLGADDRPVVWADTVISPGATFIRVHFTALHLAPGDYLTVSSADGSQVWKYTGRGPRGDGDLWAFAVNGDAAIVEVHGGRGTGHGYVIDKVGHGTWRPIPEVVCGSDGREDVVCHLSEIDATQKPVARLLFVSGGYQYLCTGWLVAGSNSNTLVTNNHCISSQTETNSLQATFNYQRTSCGGSTNATTSTYAGNRFLKTNTVDRKGKKGGLDYTLLTLVGSAETTWGELIPTKKSVAVGDLIWFIQHPGGYEKEIGYWDDAAHTTRCAVNAINQTYSLSAAGSQTAYSCDSEGGSSGSPIIDPATGHVIALHHFGGVASSPCLNSGTAMAKICADAGSLLSCVNN